MANEASKIANRVSFRVRRDGLYRLINRGRWRRVARRSKTLQLRFRLGRLVIEQGSGNSAGDHGVRQAIDQVLKRLTELDEIVEVRRDRRSVRAPENLEHAAGFLIRVPGIGPTLAVKPAALRNWVHGAVPFRRVLAGLDAKGQLIRGADGKTTRQVVIPGLGRGRYYCFKAIGGRVPRGSRPSQRPSRQPGMPSVLPAVVPIPPPDSDLDDDWGPSVPIASNDHAARGHCAPNRPTSPAAQGREGRELGTVATWRGLRPIKGG